MIRLFIVLLTALLISSCGQTTDNEGVKHIVTLRLGMNMGSDSIMYRTASKMREEISNITNGEINIEIFHSQELGTDQQMAEMAIKGELDMVLTPTAKLSYLVPSMAFFDLPFLLPAREDVYALIDGKFGELLFQRLEPYGLHGVTLWENGFKQFTSNSKLTNIKDFEGKTFRIMQNPVIYDQFKVLKAKAIPIDFYKTYEALRDGVIDGEENPLAAIYHMKFYHYQKHLTVSNHAYLGYVFYLSDSCLSKLTKQQKDLLYATIRKHTEHQRKQTTDFEREILQKIKDSGVTVEIMDDTVKKDFNAKLSALRDKYWSIVGNDLMVLAEQYLKEKYGKPTDDSYVIAFAAPYNNFTKMSEDAIEMGIQMAIENINKKGGLKGKPVRLMRFSSLLPESDNFATLKLLNDNNKLLGAFVGRNAEVTMNIKPVLQNMNIPVFVTMQTSDALRTDTAKPEFMFSISGDEKEIADLLVKRALKYSGRVGILGVNNKNGYPLLNQAKQTISAKGINSYYAETFLRNETNFLPIITNLMYNGVEVVIFIGSALELNNFLDEAKKLSASFRVFTHWGTSGTSANLNAPSKTDMKIERLSVNADRAFESERFKTLLRDCTLCSWDYNGKDFLPASIQTFDMTEMIFKAAEASAVVSGDSIRDQLSLIETHNGLLKTYSKPFKNINHEALGAEDFSFKSLDCK